jgi:L-alanine-DL-glutamate epimerase-like enolase superfamily enzyme
VPLYGSGINLNMTIDQLVDQAQQWRARGYRSIKIKVGKESLAEDVERVAAVKAAVPDVGLMVDANQGWTLTEAVRRIRALEQFSLVWVEEPLLVDDPTAHAQLVDKVRCPIALGENLYTIWQFKELMAHGAIDYVQADIARVGGITPYLRVADLAAAYQLPMAPHFIMELSAEVAASVRNLYMVEDTAGGTLRELGAVTGDADVSDGWYPVGRRPGLGVEWDREWLQQHRAGALQASYG